MAAITSWQTAWAAAPRSPKRASKVEHDYPNRDLFLGEMQALFERDWKNIEAGLYAAPAALDRPALKTLRRSLDFLRDVPEVARRRRDHVHDEVLSDELREAFPALLPAELPLPIRRLADGRVGKALRLPSRNAILRHRRRHAPPSARAHRRTT